MFMICKKTGEEYEITDREIGEKIECPCCGEEYVVDWTVLPGDVYEAALIRKTEQVARGTNQLKLSRYTHDDESEYEKLFSKAFECCDRDAQFLLGKRLYDAKHYALAAYWFCEASFGEHAIAEASYRYAECLWNGIGVRKNIERAVGYYKEALDCGYTQCRSIVEKFEAAEYSGVMAGDEATFFAVQSAIGDIKKYEE